MGLLDALFGGSKGDDSAAREMKEEEARRAGLRRRIDAFYGIDTPEAALPVPDKGLARKLLAKGVMAKNEGIAAGNAARTGQAADARSLFERENKQLGDSVRNYYTDSLNRNFGESQRKLNFALARKGLAGGSAQIDNMADLTLDKNLGATRIGEAVQRHVNDLINQREQERLGAYSLVASGAGESAVQSAQAGLRRAFDTQSSAQKADLFGDLFAGGADALYASNMQDQGAAMANRFRSQLNPFFASPTRSSPSGRVTSS